MKTYQKLALTGAIVIVIAIVALFIRKNWGTLLNDAVNMTFEAVTGTDPKFDGFKDESGGTDTGDVDAEW